MFLPAVMAPCKEQSRNAAFQRKELAEADYGNTSGLGGGPPGGVASLTGESSPQATKSPAILRQARRVKRCFEFLKFCVFRTDIDGKRDEHPRTLDVSLTRVRRRPSPHQAHSLRNLECR
jgi:hypothetical protein